MVPFEENNNISYRDFCLSLISPLNDEEQLHRQQVGHNPLSHANTFLLQKLDFKGPATSSIQEQGFSD